MNRDKPDIAAEESGEKKIGRVRERSPREHNRRWLFLVVDIVLLATIVAAVIFLVSLLTPFSNGGSDADETRNITYTVELAGVYRDSVSVLRTGDIVTDKETGAVIGRITAIDARAYTPYTDIPTEEKDPVLDSYVVTKAEYPEEFNTVEITISVAADYTAGVGYTVNGCRIAVGRCYELCFPSYTGNVTCIELEIQ